MIGPCAAIAASFRSLQVRRVRAPWTHPDGTYLEIEIRPHDDPEYLKAIKEAGINPRSIDQRAADTPKISPLQAIHGRELSEEDQKLVRQAESANAEIVQIGFPWREYPATYDLAEVKAACPFVLKHLVAGVRTASAVASNGADAPDPVPATEQEVEEWFASRSVIPFVVPALVMDSEEEPAKEAEADIKTLIQREMANKQTGQYLGGVEEGVAAAAFVLSEAVRADKFLEQLVPLATGSASSPDEMPTTEPKPEAKGKSRQGSTPPGSAAKTPAVQAAA